MREARHGGADRFFRLACRHGRLHRRGTGSVGLGLNIANNLASGRLGGTLSIASRAGGGTLATLHVPPHTPPDLWDGRKTIVPIVFRP